MVMGKAQLWALAVQRSGNGAMEEWSLGCRWKPGSHWPVGGAYNLVKEQDLLWEFLVFWSSPPTTPTAFFFFFRRLLWQFYGAWTPFQNLTHVQGRQNFISIVLGFSAGPENWTDIRQIDRIKVYRFIDMNFTWCSSPHKEVKTWGSC